MKPAPFTLHRPTGLAEACALLARYAPEDGRIIAGGQSLAPIMAFRMARPPHLIDINRVEGLDVLREENGALRIGARVRHAALGALPGATGALLAKVMRNIAHAPIRNRGTFCGSLAHADPASEWCALATALDAELVAVSERGERRIAAADYFQGLMTTALEPDELLAEARLKLVADDARTGFIEFSRRAGDFALAMALIVFRVADGVIAEPRLVIGGAESHPRRFADVEAMLAGAQPGADLWSAAADRIAETLDPLEDATTSGDYRRDLARLLTIRACEQAMA